MSEMIERVARTVFDAFPSRDLDGRTIGWDDGTVSSDGKRRDALAFARVAIEAMREPTQAMLDAVTAYDQQEPFSDATMRSVYQEMIGTALD